MEMNHNCSPSFRPDIQWERRLWETHRLVLKWIQDQDTWTLISGHLQGLLKDSSYSLLATVYVHVSNSHFIYLFFVIFLFIIFSETIVWKWFFNWTEGLTYLDPMMYGGGFSSAPVRVYSWAPRSCFQLEIKKKKKVSLVHWAGSCTALTSGALSVPGCPCRTQECVSGTAPESSVHYPNPHIYTQTILCHTFIYTLAPTCKQIVYKL